MRRVAVLSSMVSIATVILSANSVYASTLPVTSAVSQSPTNSGHSNTNSYNVDGTLSDASGRLVTVPMTLVDQNGNQHYVSFSSNGTFEAANVPDGKYTFHFYMPGYQLSHLTTVTIRKHNRVVRLSLAETTYTISGVATLNGQPVANASVGFDMSGYTFTGFWPDTDQNGHFTITGLLPDTYTLLIGANPQNDPTNPEATAIVTGTEVITNQDITGVVIGN